MEVKLTTDLGNVLVDAVNALCDKLGIVFDWTAENVYPIAQELFNEFVAYRTVSSWAEILIPAILLMLFTFLSWLNDRNGDDFSILWGALAIIAGLAFVGCSIDGIIHLIRCYNFPELELYKWLASRGVI